MSFTTFSNAAPILALVARAPALHPAQGGGTPHGSYVVAGITPGTLAGVESWDGMENLAGAYSVRGNISHQLHQKEIQLAYRAKLDSTGQEVCEADIDESIAFWPTYATFLAPDLVAVAGKGQDPAQLNTVIEIWQLRVPQVRVSIHPTTGQSQLDLFPLGVRSKTTVYDAAVEGRDMVRALLRVRGQPNGLLVQFCDSGDLYALDYGDAVDPPANPAERDYPMVKLFRATPGTDVPYVPGLGDHRRLWMHGADHQTLGQMYVLWPSFEVRTSEGSAAPLPIVFFDGDRDGDLDARQQSTAAQNQSNGILDESSYTEKFLRTQW